MKLSSRYLCEYMAPLHVVYIEALMMILYNHILEQASTDGEADAHTSFTCQVKPTTARADSSAQSSSYQGSKATTFGQGTNSKASIDTTTKAGPAATTAATGFWWRIWRCNGR